MFVCLLSLFTTPHHRPTGPGSNDQWMPSYWSQHNLGSSCLENRWKKKYNFTIMWRMVCCVFPFLRIKCCTISLTLRGVSMHPRPASSDIGVHWWMHVGPGSFLSVKTSSGLWCASCKEIEPTLRLSACYCWWCLSFITSIVPFFIHCWWAQKVSQCPWLSWLRPLSFAPSMDSKFGPLWCNWRYVQCEWASQATRFLAGDCSSISAVRIT